jgi:hypothetical protein
MSNMIKAQSRCTESLLKVLKGVSKVRVLPELLQREGDFRGEEADGGFGIGGTEKIELARLIARYVKDLDLYTHFQASLMQLRHDLLGNRRACEENPEIGMRIRTTELNQLSQQFPLLEPCARTVLLRLNGNPGSTEPAGTEVTSLLGACRAEKETPPC